MRFLTRSFLGVFLLGLTLGILVLAGGMVWRTARDSDAETARERPARERVFAINVATLTSGNIAPVITTFGEVASWRNLEVRAVTGGRIIELADAFRDGGEVARGQLLARIDPVDMQAALDLARTRKSEAKAEVEDAEAALLLARDDLKAAAEQRDLRVRALNRQKDLTTRGAGTAAAVETAELALSSAEQTLLGRRQALAQAEARIKRAGIALDQQKIMLAEAERTLAETSIDAPFAGLLSDIRVVQGGLVTPNQALATLIDPSALEIAFRVSNAQFARLITQDGELRDVSITATLPLDEFPLTVSGRIDRAGARVGDGQTGRLLYARIDGGTAAALRPGDFMLVEIEEPALSDVTVIPATAANSQGEILLIGADDRLEPAMVNILRRQGDTLIVKGAPLGREYATERLPQIGEGVKIRPVRPTDARADDSADAPDASDTVALDDDRRARLIAFVEGNTRMPGDIKARLLDQLSAAQVPRATVERLERRMGG